MVLRALVGPVLLAVAVIVVLGLVATFESGSTPSVTDHGPAATALPPMEEVPVVATQDADSGAAHRTLRSPTPDPRRRRHLPR